MPPGNRLHCPAGQTGGECRHMPAGVVACIGSSLLHGGPRWAVRVALARARRCSGDRLVPAFHLGPSARFDQAEDWAVLRSPSEAVAGSRAECGNRWEEVTRARHQWG